MGIQRMVQAGVKPITWPAVLYEWQRDWARQETFSVLGAILLDHGGGSGVAFGRRNSLPAAANRAAQRN